MPALFAIEWRPRRDPLAPTAAIALEAAARRLAHRMLQLDDAALGRLRGVAGDAAIAVLGEADVLPWVDGIEYLGRTPEAPSLLLPTCLEPSVGDALFERVIVRSPGGAPPLAISPARRRAFSLASARPIERNRLGDWLARSGDS
jgi:hypothetical protein